MSISKEEFAEHLSQPSMSLMAYFSCPVCCSSSYDICVSTIKKLECRRYEDLKALLDKLRTSNEAKPTEAKK